MEKTSRSERMMIQKLFKDVSHTLSQLPDNYSIHDCSHLDLHLTGKLIRTADVDLPEGRLRIFFETKPKGFA